MTESKNHSFVICAYGESPFLEQCIRSLQQQTISSIIMLATSTPSIYLEQLCRQYQIEYCVREGTSSITSDWNYALAVAGTPYVTIAHQDDIYEPDYTQRVMEQVQCCENRKKTPVILFTDYSELVAGIKYPDRRNLKIKKILLHPLRKVERQHRTLWKRHILRFGNAVCCPSVTYHMEYIRELLKEEQRESLFEQHFRSNLDWQAWEWLSRKEGVFAYIPEVLMAHRIHEESETTATIQEHLRRHEDYEMFCRFWPKWIAKLITGVYTESEKSNQIE